MARAIRVSVVDQLVATKFIATDEQVGRLAEQNLSAVQTQENIRGVYLKVLVAGVQQETRPAGRRKAGNAGEALTKVHDHFYAVVMKAITTPDVADEPTLDQEARTLRSLERNRRTTFARTARAAIMGFIKAGGDVLTLDATKVTKRELQAFATSMARHQPVQEELEHKTNLAADRVEELARQLADSDKDAAIILVEEAMAKLANLLAEFGKDSTTKTMVAIREHRPLRLGEGTFWPMGRTSVPTSKETSVQ